MSVTSEELNYLIWRYLQEAGHEVTAFALQDETKVHKLDERFGSRVNIGCLVDLVQKGILFTEDENLVNEKGQLKSKEELQKSFSLFGAIENDKNEKIEFKGRFALAGDEEGHEMTEDEGKETEKDSEMKDADVKEKKASSILNEKEIPEQEKEEEFVKVLEKSYTFKASVATSWNPQSSKVLSLGEHDSTAEIKVLGGDEPSNTVTLIHPLSLAADFSINSKSHKEEITAVSWAPKGHYLLTASENGELRLWTAEGKLRNVLTLHHSPILSIKWNQDSTYILTLDSQNNVIVWNTATGSAIQHIDQELLKSLTSNPHNTNQESGILGSDCTWINNTKFAIPGIDGTIVLFQLNDKTPIGYLFGHTMSIGCLSYNSKLHLLASGSDDASIRIWKSNSSSSVQTLLGHDQGIVSIDWLELASDNNTPLLLSSSLDGSVKLWNVYSGALLLSNFMDGIPIYEASLSPNKKWFAVATEEGVVSIFDVTSENLTKIIQRRESMNSVGHLKTLAQYQPEASNENDSNFVTSISWNCDSKLLCVAYNKSETVVIDWGL
ncbi:Sif2 protein [Saccharomycopsis crataegensis]|uniref:Sif2 protein n=1 Tax=Saccharomycopsis crataegensis TaxID=43959 RepID=A0AAV5QV78_9ASCO|nr:Sif2 protein [Saccharomycopsis crataegensis]